MNKSNNENVLQIIINKIKILKKHVITPMRYITY